MTRRKSVDSLSLSRAGWRAAGLTSVLVTLAGCVLEPDWLRLSRAGDLEQLHLSSGKFDHIVLLNKHTDAPLYLYIEGDGTPWIREKRVAIDPTPANPVLLRLMARSEHAGAYLGRPCYFGTATSRDCEPRHWTFERYGPDVIRAMCDVANQLVARSRAASVVLVGYSGGAAIASAMRGCVDQLAGVVSVAGNLDPESWARYHGYSPLAALPMLASPASFDGYEIHWQCKTDKVVPPRVTERYFEHNPAAERRLIDNCTHSTGWETYWPRIVPRSPTARATSGTTGALVLLTLTRNTSGTQ